jgi:hypothetical protein
VASIARRNSQGPAPVVVCGSRSCGGRAVTTYVDVQAAPDYLVVDTYAFDDTFWAQNQTQLNADAAKYNKQLSLRGNKPTDAPSYAVTTITSIAQFDNLIRLSDTSANPLGAVVPSSTTGWVIAGAAAVAIAVTAWILLRK